MYYIKAFYSKRFFRFMDILLERNTVAM